MKYLKWGTAVLLVLAMSFPALAAGELHQAAKIGDYQTVVKLVCQKVDVNGRLDGYTPLMLAAKNNRFEIVKYLVTNKIQKADVLLETQEGKTAADLTTDPAIEEFLRSEELREKWYRELVEIAENPADK